MLRKSISLLKTEWQQVQHISQYSFRSQQHSPVTTQISISSNLNSSVLGIVPNASTLLGMILTFILDIFLSSQARSWYFSNFSLSYMFTLWPTGTVMSIIWNILFYICIYFFIHDYQNWFHCLDDVVSLDVKITE